MRLLQQFHPYTWSEFLWRESEDPVTEVLINLPWMLAAVLECNSFFIINCSSKGLYTLCCVFLSTFWRGVGFSVVPSHPFNFLRQFAMLFIGVPAVQEWYDRYRGKHFIA